MSYFKNLPVAVIDFSELGEDPKEYLITDIISNVRAKATLLTNLTYYDEYDIKDGETPEIISELIYGTPLYHWVIMLTNERYDYIYDFPLQQKVLDSYITAKYGNTADDIRHYVSSDGFVVMSDYVNPQGVADANPVTNYEYELEQNELKRRIKIIPPDLLGDVLRQFREIMK